MFSTKQKLLKSSPPPYCNSLSHNASQASSTPVNPSQASEVGADQTQNPMPFHSLHHPTLRPRRCRFVKAIPVHSFQTMLLKLVSLSALTLCVSASAVQSDT